MEMALIYKTIPIYRITSIDETHRTREYHKRPTPDEHLATEMNEISQDEESRPLAEEGLGQIIDTTA